MPFFARVKWEELWNLRDGMQEEGSQQTSLEDFRGFLFSVWKGEGKEKKTVCRGEGNREKGTNGSLRPLGKRVRKGVTFSCGVGRDELNPFTRKDLSFQRPKRNSPGAGI